MRPRDVHETEKHHAEATETKIHRESQNPKIQYFRGDAITNFGFLEFGIYGFLDFWMLMEIQNSKNP